MLQHPKRTSQNNIAEDVIVDSSILLNLAALGQTNISTSPTVAGSNAVFCLLAGGIVHFHLFSDEDDNSSVIKQNNCFAAITAHSSCCIQVRKRGNARVFFSVILTGKSPIKRFCSSNPSNYCHQELAWSGIA